MPKYALPLCCLLALGVVTAAFARASDSGDTRHLREAVQRGDIAPLSSIIEDALRRVPGRVIDVEFDLEDDEYEIEILDAEGRVWELEYRASTGEFKEMERD